MASLDKKSLSSEASWAADYVAMEAHGALKSVLLADIIEDADCIARIYEVTIEPDRGWHLRHPQIKPDNDWWVVALEHLQGEHKGYVAPLNLYSKEKYPLPKDVYKLHREIIDNLR